MATAVQPEVVENLMEEARRHLDEPMIRYDAMWTDRAAGWEVRFCFVEGRSREETILAFHASKRGDMAGALDTIDIETMAVAHLFTPTTNRFRFVPHRGPIPDSVPVWIAGELPRPPVAKKSRRTGSALRRFLCFWR